MSCKKCDERQDQNIVAYYRWKNANIAMSGCDEHLREIFNALEFAQSAKEKETK
jgi:hypothetical protein